MFREILQYTKVADGKLIEIFQQNQRVSAKAISLFSHVLNAQHVWAHRILDRPVQQGVWENLEVGCFEKIAQENFNLFAEILNTISMDEEITYKNATGEYTNTVQDILFHVFNHSTYHRGQIASLLKLDEIFPPVTDYIILKREHQL
ncbi:damage-inducible protein DinB [Pedobacter yonginense]|uniref:Damage-inducible protein DinB n=1 Tax=Pedobacter yonginense TaxID=651869 RepID=A0A317EQ05_9SPHI|nr:DinB family protein [Pedobacter yonginense]PWS27366.1 damage-inducible protein DinB [Pedobacter yonginense]